MRSPAAPTPNAASLVEVLIPRGAERLGPVRFPVRRGDLASSDRMFTRALEVAADPAALEAAEGATPRLIARTLYWRLLRLSPGHGVAIRLRELERFFTRDDFTGRNRGPAPTACWPAGYVGPVAAGEWLGDADDPPLDEGGAPF